MSNHKPSGLRFSRLFTQEGKSPYEMFRYSLRTSVIRNPEGDVVFQMDDVEVPEGWSQIATDILAQKYFRKAGVPQSDGSEGRETSIKQVVHRMVHCWKTWGERNHYFASKADADIFYDELAYCMLNQACVPNSPQWFNTGLHESYGITGKPQGHYFVNPETGKVQKSTSAYERPQPHACARYNTRVFTREGMVQIGEIVEQNLSGIEVFDGHDFVKVLAVKNNGVKKVFRATLSNGNFIECTGDHLVWASDKRRKDGGSYTWEQLDTLIGKKVQQTTLANVVPELELITEMAAEAGNTITKRPFSFTRQLMETVPEEQNRTTADSAYARAALAGWIVGDGYYGKYNRNKKTTMFGAIAINEDEYGYVTDLFQKTFGTYTTVTRKNIHDLYRIVQFNHKQVAPFVEAYELNQSSLSAHVPEKIMMGSVAEKCLFLRSLFQTDGCVRVRQENGSNSGEIVLTSMSEELVHGVQLLLMTLGIYSNISLVKDQRDNRHNRYQLLIAYDSERKKFAQRIGFVSADKCRKLERLNKEIKGKQKSSLSELTVLSVDYIGEETVYDIQTETGQFAANGITVHNCFILSVEDDLVNDGGIMDLWVREARIFKYGSGVGSNFSKIRAAGEILSGGGTSSGLMSFLKIGDRAAGAIKSGGTTRRAAKMVCLDLDHPEVIDFIDWKVEEEKKVAALMEAGFKGGYEGEAYLTVSGQNSNNSLRIPNRFFHTLAEGGEWELTARTDGKPMRKIPAKDLWDKIAYAAWRCADPGTQFDSTINEWHTCPQGGKIRASNPCVTADTFVATHKGLERIGNITGRSRAVKGSDGKMHWVEHIFPTGTKDIFTLKTRSGYEIRLTGNHKIYTLNRGDVEAKDLTKDDIVLLSKGQFGIESAGSADTLQLIGLLLGDGCITTQNGQDTSGNPRRIAFLNMSKEEEPILTWANDYINHTLRPQFGAHQKCGAQQEAAAAKRIAAGAPRMLGLLEEFAVLDKGSDEKKLTDKVFVLNRDEQAALLRGLFTADGCVANYGDKSQYVALDSCSLTLLKQVQLLLLNFGIKSKLYTNRRAGKVATMLPDGKGGTKEHKVKEMHALRISRNSRVLFEEYINFMEQSGKAEQLAILNKTVASYKETLADRVASLEFAGTEEVFDLTEPETHHFVANGIVVHNCSEYMFLDNTACNLASINLRKFFDADQGVFDVDGLEHTVRLWTVVLEISVLMAQFPSKEVARLSYDYRTLGLGFANLGSTLMVNGIPYDSDEARGIGGALAAVMTGTAYRTSAEMARELGPFAKYDQNRKAMMRVMRNHRAAAYDAADAYEQLEIKPQGIRAQHCPDYLLKAATRAWDDAVQMGEKYGYRNAQTTVIAPTGTIGLVMDCDTTGVEPDFALVKFKKLSGGGYFKIINQSIPLALSNLGYQPQEVKAIVEYAKGAGTLTGAPFINPQRLSEKGFLAEEIKILDKAVETAFEIGFVFNVHTLGEPCLKRLGFVPEVYKSPGFNLLAALGFSDEEIEKANDYVCGTMTVEGAPYLKAEHLPIFDCANKCGQKGQRFIHAHGHIRMMAAVQPFISGAISKTINLPNEATIAAIADAYKLSWELGLKACALYRDGSKLSQPLSNKSETKNKKKKSVTPQEVAQLLPEMDKLTIDELLEEITQRLQQSPDTKLMRKLSGIVQRKQLPAKRRGFTQKAKVGGQAIFLRTGEYGDGTLGEIFIDMAKEGATMRSMLNCFAIAISIGLQYGVPLEEFVDKFVFTRFDPAGRVDHPNIRSATSIVDYIFRVLGYEYLQRSDLVHVTDQDKQIPAHKPAAPSVAPLRPTVSERQTASATKNTTDEFLSSLQSDAPACNVCGHITIRNGTCYKCLNCGNSMGCS